MARPKRADSLRGRVLDALATTKVPVSNVAIAIAANASPRRVTSCCGELVGAGFVIRTSDGRFMLPLVYPKMPRPRGKPRPLVACVGVRCYPSLRESPPVGATM